MCKYLKEVSSFEKTDEFDEEDVFVKIKEIMENVPSEAPSFALSSMVMDGFKQGGSICQMTKDISLTSEIPSSFSPF